MSDEAARGMERARHLANRIVRLLNAAQDPADALTALQLVSASVLEHMGIPPELWMHRVIVSIERIRSGSIATKEDSLEATLEEHSKEDPHG